MCSFDVCRAAGSREYFGFDSLSIMFGPTCQGVDYTGHRLLYGGYVGFLMSTSSSSSKGQTKAKQSKPKGSDDRKQAETKQAPSPQGAKHKPKSNAAKDLANAALINEAARNQGEIDAKKLKDKLDIEAINADIKRLSEETSREIFRKFEFDHKISTKIYGETDSINLVEVSKTYLWKLRPLLKYFLIPIPLFCIIALLVVLSEIFFDTYWVTQLAIHLFNQMWEPDSIWEKVLSIYMATTFFLTGNWIRLWLYPVFRIQLKRVALTYMGPYRAEQDHSALWRETNLDQHSMKEPNHVDEYGSFSLLTFERNSKGYEVENTDRLDISRVLLCNLLSAANTVGELTNVEKRMEDFVRRWCTAKQHMCNVILDYDRDIYHDTLFLAKLVIALRICRVERLEQQAHWVFRLAHHVI